MELIHTYILYAMKAVIICNIFQLEFIPLMNYFHPSSMCLLSIYTKQRIHLS